MKITNYWLILIKILNCIVVYSDAADDGNKKQTFLDTNKPKNIFLQRSKRYLIFEKGSSVTFQGNMAKSVIPPSPRGLNFIAEYTLNYDLPTGFYLFQTKEKKTTKNSVSATKAPYNLLYPEHVIIPYNHHYSEYLYSKSHAKKRNYVKKKKWLPQKCMRQNLYDHYRKKYSKICLKRFKRYERNGDDMMTTLTISQRMFYDLIEIWSLLHGLLPRYCFMRSLCESSQLLLPYGQSLLHDIIYIMLRYTKPWAFRHKIFGRSLRKRYSIDECAKLYGPYCRASWLEFITNVVHGDGGDDGYAAAGPRTVDFMR